PPRVELHSIDDVPFLTLTLWSDRQDSSTLRPLAAELAVELSEILDTTKAYLIGGQPRVIRVEPDLDRMASAGVSWSALTGALRAGSAVEDAGTSVRNDREIRLQAGPLFRTSAEVSRVVVAVRGGRPTYVSDVARVSDGPDEATDAVFFSAGPAGAKVDRPAGKEFAAVTLALGKRPGTNATLLADQALAKVTSLRSRLIPADVHVDVTRNYGETDRDKSNELVQHLLLATLSVVALI